MDTCRELETDIEKLKDAKAEFEVSFNEFSSESIKEARTQIANLEAGRDVILEKHLEQFKEKNLELRSYELKDIDPNAPGIKQLPNGDLLFYIESEDMMIARARLDSSTGSYELELEACGYSDNAFDWVYYLSNGETYASTDYGKELVAITIDENGEYKLGEKTISFDDEPTAEISLPGGRLFTVSSDGVASIVEKGEDGELFISSEQQVPIGIGWIFKLGNGDMLTEHPNSHSLTELHIGEDGSISYEEISLDKDINACVLTCVLGYGGPILRVISEDYTDDYYAFFRKSSDGKYHEVERIPDIDDSGEFHRLPNGDYIYSEANSDEARLFHETSDGELVMNRVRTGLDVRVTDAINLPNGEIGVRFWGGKMRVLRQDANGEYYCADSFEGIIDKTYQLADGGPVLVEDTEQKVRMIGERDEPISLEELKKNIPKIAAKARKD